MEITDWYKQIKGSGMKRDKSFKNHRIEPCSMIMLIGASGSGKSTALIDFIYRAPKFTEIHLFSGSGNASTEPLYKLLLEKIPEVKTYDSVEEIPDLETFEKDDEKLIIFDDWLQLTPKQMKKLAQFATAGRKSGFSCIYQSQNYTSVPKVISRNIHYFWLFHINDARSVETICKNHNAFNITQQQFKDLHRVITKEPRNFLMVDLRGNELRKNFLQKIVN